jgi:hypothetical protein
MNEEEDNSNESIEQLLGKPFVAKDVPKEDIPPGWHTVVVEKSEVRKTKDGAGRYLYVEAAIAEGESEGRKVFLRFNIINKNPTAQRIGQSQMAAVVEACGLYELHTGGELIGRTFSVKVKIKDDRAEYAGAKPAAIGGASAPSRPATPAYIPAAPAPAYIPAQAPAPAYAAPAPVAAPQGAQPTPTGAKKMPWEH